MNRARAYFPLDDAPQPDGDTRFVGVNERLAPWQLPPGYVSYAKNCRFDRGDVSPRLGDSVARWMKTDGLTRWTAIYTAGTYTDPAGLEWLVICADGGVWATRPNNVAISVPCPVTLTAATAIQLVQCNNTLVLLRDADNAPLALTDLGAGFAAITQTASGTGTEAIPNSGYGWFFANRLLVKSGRDTVAVSDVLDYTRYVPVLQEFKINQGDNDELVAFYPFDENTMLMFKANSIWKVTNVYGDLTEARLRNVTRKYGCAAPFSIVDYGTDIAWMSERGVMTLGLTEQNEIQGTDIALSDELVRTMGRVNWKYIENCVAASYDSKLYFAVPVDDAEIVGSNLVSGTYSASAGTDATTNLPYGTLAVAGLTVGATYEWTGTSSFVDQAVYDGATGYYGHARFVAANTSVTLRGAPSTAAQCTLKEIKHSGVCNAVLVYDTRNRAWAGVDERTGMAIRRFVRVTLSGQERLCYVSWDGELRLYEEGYEDEAYETLTTPYVDLFIRYQPAAGQTLRVGGGDTITSTGDVANSGTNWGAVTAALARSNLWNNSSKGYDPSLAAEWSAPDTTPAQISWGVRFTATNGTIPAVSVNGGAVTASGLAGTGSWLYVDRHTGTEIGPVDISTQVDLRGYLCNEADRKRYQHLRLQLSTWNPTYTIATLTDGVSEIVTQVSGKTRSRTAYDRPAGKAAWDSTNANDDFSTAYRQDYSISLPDLGISPGTNGIDPTLHQEWLEKVRLNDRGLYTQVRLTNTTGRCILRLAGVSALPGERADKTLS